MKSIEEIIKDEAEEIYSCSDEFGREPAFNTEQGIIEIERKAYIAGRSKSIESEKAKDERIKELEDALKEMLKWKYCYELRPEEYDTFHNMIKSSEQLLKK